MWKLKEILCSSGNFSVRRLWRIISYSASIIMCIIFIYEAWSKYNVSPVIISIAERETPATDIPFPTVTICHQRLIDPNAWNNSAVLKHQLYKTNFAGLTNQDETIAKFQSFVQFGPWESSLDRNTLKTKNITINRNMLPYLQNITHDVRHFTYINLNGTGRGLGCQNLFTETLTEDGICYTFNQQSSSEIYRMDLMANDFPTVDKFESFCRNSYGSTVNFSYPYAIHSKEELRLIFRVPQFLIDFGFVGAVQDGWKIKFHPTEDVPRMREHFYYIPFGHETTVKVRPNLMRTTPELIQKYDKTVRKCIVEQENHLVFFRKYSQTNCHLEKLVIKVKQRCNCVLFWMPRTNDTNVCIVKEELQCVAETEKSMKAEDLNDVCLPLCNTTTYDVEMTTPTEIIYHVSQTEWPRTQYDMKVSIVIKEQHYHATTRSELYGKMELLDFIATCGGVLNLFLGISLLNVIELIYIATIRRSCNLHIMKKCSHCSCV